MHQKSKRVRFLMHRNELIKIVQALSMVHGMVFLCHTYSDFLILTDTFQRLEANDCDNTSFVQSETRTLVLHSVNLSMCV